MFQMFLIFLSKYQISSNIQKQRGEPYVLHLSIVKNVQELELNQKVLSGNQTFQMV